MGIGSFMGFFKRNPKTIELPVKEKPRKKVGVAFGGGGFKGAAHVGVLKVLEEYKVPIDMAAGTSIGSAIAALYGSGLNAQQMQLLFEHFDIESLIRVRPSRKGLIPADGYIDFIRTCTKGRRIEEMRIPIKLVAVDLISRKRILFDAGDTAIAVRASSAVPGIFTPVEMGNMVLVDGYVLDNCPGNVVRGMGADVVIAISLHTPDFSKPKNMLDVVNRAMDIAASAYQQIDADIVLSPINEYMDFLDTSAIAKCFELGEACARAQIDNILKLIEG